MEPDVYGSWMAAAYNGAALAHRRAGDRSAAVQAELAALDALTAPEVLAGGGLHEQQIQVLANLAKVYGTDELTRERALELLPQRLADRAAPSSRSADRRVRRTRSGAMPSRGW